MVRFLVLKCSTLEHSFHLSLFLHSTLCALQMYVHVYVCVYAFTSALRIAIKNVHALNYIHANAHVHTSTHIRMFMCVFTEIIDTYYVWTHMVTYPHPCTYVDTHIHTDAHRCTYILRNSLLVLLCAFSYVE